MGALTAFAVAVAALSVPFVAADSPASTPHITSVKYSGNGCPNNANLAGDFNDPTFSYNHFVASTPGGNRTVNCAIHVESAGASPGWQVALSDVNVKAHVALNPGARLDYWSQAFWSDDAADDGTIRSIVNNGASKVDYTANLHQDVPLVWSVCTNSNGNPGILNVNFRASLTTGSGSFEALTQNWDFVWRRC